MRKNTNETDNEGTNEKKGSRKWIILLVIILIILAFMIAVVILYLGKKGKSYESMEDDSNTTQTFVEMDVEPGKTDTKKPGKAVTETTKKTTEANAKNGISKRNGNAAGLTDHAPTEAVTETPTEKPTETPTETPTTETTKPTEKPTETTTEKPTETTTEPTTEKPTETTTETTTEATTECSHNFVAQYKTEKVEVEPAWKEYVEEDRNFCSYCEKDITGNEEHVDTCGEKVYNPDMGWIWTGASILIKPVVVNTIYHDAIYENQKVLTGYKCSKCGKWK